ncbi:Glycosyl transferases group 1 [Allochromatium warmingii]|uniref:Glycosyl transferases group 1 n=1 Tax=Allochromatium warmingii TaxID=61595 RepID=A0A1H3E7F6_ALLWA|nr:glycosyltransferase [Allochromatium warmingii]SDX73864.1 Glycosyl transferases group 1 [Allochromatium warmingii]
MALPAKPKSILYLEPGFPGQYRHLIQHFAALGGVRQIFLHDAAQPITETLSGIETYAYQIAPHGSGCHRYAQNFNTSVQRADAVRDLALHLKASGFVPEVVCAHGGFGEGLFIKRVFPDARLVVFMEYYYGTGDLIGSDPRYAPETRAQRESAQIRNALVWLTHEIADVAITPTPWQRDLHPPDIRRRLRVIHDGIDTDWYTPDAEASFVLPNGDVLQAGDPIVTFVARSLEPLRGVHTVLHALPRVLRTHPHAQALIVGRDQPLYGPSHAGRESHFARLWRVLQTQPEARRIHHLPWLNHQALRTIYRLSAAHIYASLPFVLSWSPLEAMASGALLVAADTAPVRDVMTHGRTAVLFRAGDATALAATVHQALSQPETLRPIRLAAREQVRHQYDLRRQCLPRLIAAMLC